MSETTPTPYQQVADLAKTLNPNQKLRLIGELVQQLQLGGMEPRKPFRSLYGVLKDLGPSPTAEDIDEMRREAWANFPREEFY